MPTIITHALIPLIAAWGSGPQRIPGRLAVAGAVAAVLPDIDVATFALGISYGDPFGHRGASHSLAFALLLGSIATLAAPALSSSRAAAFVFVTLSAASHGLTDMLTNGGLGVALIWPFSQERLFAPVTPVEVSPIGRRFFSSDGLTVLGSEALWLLLPLAFAAWIARRYLSLGTSRD